MTHLIVTEIKEGFWDNLELVHSEEELRKSLEYARSIKLDRDVWFSIYDIELVKQYKFPGVNHGKARGTED